MRCRYNSTSCREVSCPLAIATCICGMVASTTENLPGPWAPSVMADAIKAQTNVARFMRRILRLDSRLVEITFEQACNLVGPALQGSVRREIVAGLAGK